MVEVQVDTDLAVQRQNAAEQRNNRFVDFASENQGDKRQKSKRKRTKSASAALDKAVNVKKEDILAYLIKSGASREKIEKWKAANFKNWQIRQASVKKLIENDRKKLEVVDETSKEQDITPKSSALPEQMVSGQLEIEITSHREEEEKKADPPSKIA